MVNFGTLREMSVSERQSMFECVDNRGFRQGSVEAPRLWQKMATQLLANVEENWVRKRMGVLLELEGQRTHQTCSFMWDFNENCCYTPGDGLG